MWVVLLGDEGCGVWGGPTRRVRAPGRKRGCTPPTMCREKTPGGAFSMTKRYFLLFLNKQRRRA